MEFDDFQTPDEFSLHKMNQEYAKTQVQVIQQSCCDECTDKSRVFSAIDWAGNDNLLRLLASRASNSCQSRYIRELLELSRRDYADLSNLYPREAGSRNNPNLIDSIPSTFNTTLGAYIQNESDLLSSLVSLLNLEDNAESKRIIYNILSRRLEAVATLASFVNGGFFG